MKNTESWKSVVMEASNAVEALVEWEPCDCGCPNKRSPKNLKSIDLLRIAAFLRLELLPQENESG